MTTERQTRHLKKAFLAAFRQHGNVSAAAQEVGVHRASIYRWQEHDEAFAAEFREAELEATESLEREAYRRAVEGVDKPVYQGGKQVGSVREYSDLLLIFLLKARAPEKYRERREVHQSGTGPVIQVVPFEAAPR